MTLLVAGNTKSQLSTNVPVRPLEAFRAVPTAAMPASATAIGKLTHGNGTPTAGGKPGSVQYFCTASRLSMLRSATLTVTDGVCVRVTR